MRLLFASQRTRSSMRYAPLPLLYLASAIRNAGHEPGLLITERREDLLGDLVDKIEQFRPDILAFSLMTDVVIDVFNAIESVKLKYKKLKIVVGGYFATAAPQTAMDECRDIDYLVRGEGEITLVELLAALRDGGDLSAVKGLVYRSDGAVVVNPPRDLIADVDQIARPAYDLADAYDFPDEAQIGEKSMMVVASRGCPYECSFCCKAVFGRTYRRRSPREVAKEIEFLVRNHGVDDINFGDALFRADREWLDQFYAEMEKRNLHVHWKCQTRLTDDLTKDDLQRMKSHGCEVIHFGIESGNDEILKSLKKGFARDEALRKLEEVKQAGIAPAGSFVFGCKGETPDSMVETYRFAQEMNLPIIFFKMLNPIPGSRDHASLPPEDRQYWKTGRLPRTCEIDQNEIAAFTRYAQLTYYTRFRYLWENVITARYHPQIRKMCLAMWIASRIGSFRMKRNMAEAEKKWALGRTSGATKASA